MPEKRKLHRVAVVVFLEGPGVDARDAADGAVLALRRAIPENFIPHTHCDPDIGDEKFEVVQIMEAGMALGNGFLWAQPTSKAFTQFVRPSRD